jgi:hypothetical protein
MVMGISARARSVSAFAVASCAVGASLVIAAPAHAAVYVCNGELCAAPTSISTSSISIREYTKVAFTGHFELVTPTGAVHNSADASTVVGGGPTFTVPGVSGTYCATEWHAGPSGYNSLGHVCFNVVA